MYLSKQEKELFKYVNLCTSQGLKVGLTHGCYDLLHTGHLAHLQACKKSVDILIVGVESDSNIKIFKGTKRPIIEQTNRYKLVQALKPVDFSFINDLKFEENSYIRMYTLLRGAFVLYGPNFGAEKQVQQRAAKLKIKTIKSMADSKVILSTTKIIDRVLERYTI